MFLNEKGSTFLTKKRLILFPPLVNKGFAVSSKNYER